MKNKHILIGIGTLLGISAIVIFTRKYWYHKVVSNTESSDLSKLKINDSTNSILNNYDPTKDMDYDNKVELIKKFHNKIVSDIDKIQSELKGQIFRKPSLNIFIGRLKDLLKMDVNDLKKFIDIIIIDKSDRDYRQTVGLDNIAKKYNLIKGIGFNPYLELEVAQSAYQIKNTK